MMPLVRMLTLDLFSLAISYQPPLCQLVVAVDAIVDGGKQSLRGNGCAAVCVVALAQGDVLGAIHAIELSKEAVGGNFAADALGLGRSVHPDAGDSAVGVEADDDGQDAAVKALFLSLDGQGAVGGLYSTGDVLDRKSVV